MYHHVAWARQHKSRFHETNVFYVTPLAQNKENLDKVVDNKAYIISGSFYCPTFNSLDNR